MKTLTRILSVVVLIVLTAAKPVTKQQKDMKLTRATATIRINAPKQKVWDAIATEFGKNYLHSPHVKSSNYKSNHTNGELGAERHLEFTSGKYGDEKIIGWEPFDKLTLEMTANSFGVKKAFSYYTLTESGGLTTITYDYDYRLKMGFMSGMMKKQFSKFLNEDLIGLKHYVETGEEVTAENFEAIKAKYIN